MGITSHRFLFDENYLAPCKKNIKICIMNELIERLTKEAGITPEQAKKAVETIAGFVKEKFPMLGGAVDNIFKTGDDN